MEDHKCDKCQKVLFNKQALERHQNNKIKCNRITEYKCPKCSKCFAQKKNLLLHTEKNNCRPVIHIVEPNKSTSFNDINNIINSNITIETKVDLIKLINDNLSDTKIRDILIVDIPLETKINILLNTKKTQATTINNTTNNNTTNNIQFNNFGNENIEYFNENYLKKLINTVNSSNKIGAQSVFLKLSNEIYLNEHHPENQTIKIDNLNNKFCKIKQNNKWITADKNESLKKIFNRACEIVSMCIMENKDMYKEAQLETINGYIEKDFDDDIVIETVKKLALDIYNFYNSTTVV
jgi:hypothetical protein